MSASSYKMMVNGGGPTDYQELFARFPLGSTVEFQGRCYLVARQYATSDSRLPGGGLVVVMKTPADDLNWSVDYGILTIGFKDPRISLLARPKPESDALVSVGTKIKCRGRSVEYIVANHVWSPSKLVWTYCLNGPRGERIDEVDEEQLDVSAFANAATTKIALTEHVILRSTRETYTVISAKIPKGTTEAVYVLLHRSLPKLENVPESEIWSADDFRCVLDNERQELENEQIALEEERVRCAKMKQEEDEKKSKLLVDIMELQRQLFHYGAERGNEEEKKLLMEKIIQMQKEIYL